ncbi:MAG: hypothetical protein OXL68_09330 [Paracoccaceae bacterium]|nr:hypothetical protein [Paracoccaceae bacterium]
MLNEAARRSGAYVEGMASRVRGDGEIPPDALSWAGNWGTELVLSATGGEFRVPDCVF